MLEPGRSAQFNSLYLDPYLWKMQVGGKRLVQKARAAGIPFDGVIVTAGIPELDESVALSEELTEAGLRHVASCPAPSPRAGRWCGSPPRSRTCR